MTNGTGGIFGRGPTGTVRQAFIDLQQSEQFREYPLQVRDAFLRVGAWVPPLQASSPVVQVNASFAKMLRDKAARERGGYKWGNYALLFVQAIVKAAVDAGTLSRNRVAQVPKLLPPRQQSSQRRGIRPIRYRISAPADSSETKNRLDESS